MTRLMATPAWEWWLVWYFFLGSLAAGLYFIAALIDLFGSERDRAMVRVAYYLVFPLVSICGILLILDLGRPEHFQPMLRHVETGYALFTSWSPMSVGAWFLCVFGGLSVLSFVSVLAEDGRLGSRSSLRLTHVFHQGLAGRCFTCFRAGVGFCVTAYTGVLLAASSQPFWSDPRLLGGLFLASAAATSTALMLLLQLPMAEPASLSRLQRVNAWALMLELVLLVGFFASLGNLAAPLLRSPYGVMLIGVTGILGLLFPLGLRMLQGWGRWTTVLGSLLVLVGGFEMRHSIFMVAQYLDIVGR